MISRTGASAPPGEPARRRAVSSTCLSPLESNRVVATRPAERAALGSGNPYSRAGLWTSTSAARLVFRTRPGRRHRTARRRPACRRTFGCGQSVPTRCARAWPPPAPARRGCPHDERPPARADAVRPDTFEAPGRSARSTQRPARPAVGRAPGPCGQSRRAAQRAAAARAAGRRPDTSTEHVGRPEHMAMGIAGARRQGVAGTGRMRAADDNRTRDDPAGKRHGHGLRPAEQCYIFDFRYRKYKYLRLPSPRIPAPPASWTSSRSSISCASPSAAASRAAEMLDVAQPTLSRQVRLLEQELGQHLLYRNGRAWNPPRRACASWSMPAPCWPWPSAPGKTCAACARRPPARCRWACRRALPGLTPPLVQAFRREFPGASIAVAEGLSAQVREWLLAGRVDLALLYDPAPHLSWPASRCSAKTWCWPPPRRSARAARTRRGQDLGAYPLVPARPAPSAHWSTASAAPRACACRWRPRSTRADHRRAGRAGRCLRHPATLSRPGTGGRARWRWPISSPPHRQQPGAGDRPPPSPRRGWPRPPPN